MGFESAKSAVRKPKAERLAPVNYFFACIANALTLVKYAHDTEKGIDTFEWLLEVDPFVWPAGLAKHFVSIGETPPPQLRRGSQDDMLECISALMNAFGIGEDQNEKQDLDHFQSGVKDALEGLQRVVEKKKLKGTALSHIVSRSHDVIFPTSKKRTKEKRAALTDEIVRDLIVALIGSQNIDTEGYIFRNLNKFVKRVSGFATVSELYTDSIFGPYFVIRKARSAVTNHPLDREVLVRDVLWLRPLSLTPGPDGVKAIETSAPSISLGYYISAVDQQVYEVTSVAIRGDFVLIDAVAFLSDSGTKSCCIYMPKLLLQNKAKASFGSILGTLRKTDRTGAWSVLPIRPAVFEEEILRYHFVFSFFADIFSAGEYLDRTKYYDPHISTLYWIFASSGRCGVVFSRNWLERAKKSESGEAGGVSVADLRDRLEAFDGCFVYSDQHIQTLDMYVDELLQDEEFYISLSDEQKVQARRVLREVYKRAEQTAINPKAIYESGTVLAQFSDPYTCVAQPYSRTTE